MNGRDFISFGASGAAVAVSGCLSADGISAGGVRNVRVESPELQAQKLKALKEAHEKYGLRLQLNVFYRNFMTFGCGAPCLNLWKLEDIPTKMKAALDNEYLIHATHEEYWYKDYFAYQPDSREKLLTACKLVHDAGYEYFFIEDKINW